MRSEWYGQSAFHLSGEEASVAIDPFGDLSALTSSRGMQFDYPEIDGVEADLLLVTHEHNGIEPRRKPQLAKAVGVTRDG